MTNRRFSKLLGFIVPLFALAVAPAVQADVLAIIVNPQLAVELDVEDIVQLYLGKKSRIQGQKLTPLMLPGEYTEHAQFSRAVLKRSSQQLHSYWTRRLFTGKGRPPKLVDSVDEMKAIVSRDAQSLGYLYISEVDKSVKTVVVVPES